ncbi:DegT/DnrJ/EryC1/StrS family aminotransferase [bacterium C-53]|nr:DegT/DnrJ/EryC1/StrS family aminotransferase [Lachnospiraceae bacterium]NBI02659.1 DegT/DnrJ/EryC1/StrS family aminotransferase [Lachnospiraceae bacterium]RKJ11298.1 DegT/DnrJ/EryC1/StrS family aminotransferase [bacterium C-53]
MEFRDLKKQYLMLKKEIDASIQNVLTNTNFISGKQVFELEEKLADYVGVKHCITCANGTDALQLSLMAWGIGMGDAVFVPDFTFFASAEVISLMGASPVFVDVRKDTFNIDTEKLRKSIQQVIEEKQFVPKAIVAVDLFGQPAEYDKIKEIANEFHLFVLEDGAQGFGGEISGKKACSFGQISTTSFFPAKPLGCYGDGGAVFTDNDEWADLIASFRIHGKGSFKYDNVRIGMNSRLDTLQAAILLQKLYAFKEYELDNVNNVAEMYTERLREIVEVPVILDGYLSSWAQYTIRLTNGEERNGLQKYLVEKGIPSMIYYPKPLHKQAAFASCVDHELEDQYQSATELCEKVLSLPMHPYMTEDNVRVVTDSVKEFLNR